MIGYRYQPLLELKYWLIGKLSYRCITSSAPQTHTHVKVPCLNMGCVHVCRIILRIYHTHETHRINVLQKTNYTVNRDGQTMQIVFGWGERKEKA